MCESAPIACELLGVVVTGKITTDWVVLKTILRLVILRGVFQASRGVFQASLQDYALFKIALSQLIVCSALGWDSYASLILLGWNSHCTTYLIGGQIIHTVKYADDLVLLAEGEKVLHDMIDKLIETGRCYGTEINVEKTKVMRISRQPSPVKTTRERGFF